MVDIEHQSGGGGWISGPMITTPHRDMPATDVRAAMDELATIAARHAEAVDQRPRYNPVAAVAAIQHDMRLAGIEPPALSDVQLDLAVMRMVKTLEAMGVAPNRPDSRPFSRVNRRSI